METNNIKYDFVKNIIHIHRDFELLGVDEAMDTILSSTFEYNTNKIILNAENISDKFFDLKTKFLGELLQKLINYNCSIAIIGQFEKYNSNALNDFIFECNRKENVGSRIFFLNDINEAYKRLMK